jgi:hypothetical protein
MYLSEDIQNKWKPVIEHDDLPKIADTHKRSVTAVLLENTERALRESGSRTGSFLTEAAPTNQTGDNIDNFDPVLISLVRRAMPNLIAYDICGVQPMTGPTGLIFAMRAKYSNSSNSGVETFYNEVNTAFSTTRAGANTLGDKNVGTFPGNTTTGTANLAETGIYNFAGGMTIAEGEALGTASSNTFPEMAFSIEKVSVTAKTRALKAEYTMELAQD